MMTEKVSVFKWWMLALLAVETTVKSLGQETIWENAANEFIIGFSVNVGESVTPSLLLFVTTPETNPVTFTVTANGFSFTGTAFNNLSTEVSIPSTFQVRSNSERNKGIYVKTERENKIVVYGLSYHKHTSDAFLALPCSHLAVEEYEYYAMTYTSRFSRRTSDVLIVGCEDNTLVTTPSNTITLSRLETYLIESSDSTGMRITSTKPVSLFSNNDCTTIPTGVSACDHLTEQIPPTSTWGTLFYAASLLGRNSGELFRVIAAKDSTTVKVNCTTFSQVQVYNLSVAGNWQEFQIRPLSFCTIESSAPILVTQFALGYNLDYVGDPFMMMLPPVEQYSNNYVLNALSSFSTNYITIYVATEYYQPNRIFVNNTSQVVSLWTSVYCSNSLLCGYITRVALRAGEHRLYHQDPHARIGVSAYGFSPHNSYGYPGGLKLTSIQFCPSETDRLWQIIWPKTPSNVTRIQRCPEERNWIGNATRYCNGTGVWSDPDVLSCTSIEFATILVEALEAFSSNDSSELLNLTANVTSQLAEATSGHEISLLPSDLQITNSLVNRVINILEDNTDVMQESQETENDVISIFNNVLDENNTAGWMNLQRVVTMNGSELLLNNAERYGLMLAQAVEAPRKLSRPNIALSASQFDTLSTVTDEDLSFPSSEDLVNYTSSITPIMASIPTNLITEKLSNSSFVPVVHILFNNLEDFLPPSLLDSSETPDGISAIYSLQIGEREVQSRVLLDTPIDLEFTFPKFESPLALNYKCAFWNFSKLIGSGGFSTDGVVTASISRRDGVTTVQCLSYHTTSFAVLVDVAGGLQTASEGELKALQAVSYVGCSISIICLSLTVLFFLTQRKKISKSVNFFVHLNLAATLLVAFVVFVFGIELGKITTGGCLFVALLLHYLFLSAFCWMLCEGILLYLLLVVVFSKIPRQRWVFVLIGYVSPIPIVVITVSSRHDYYGVRNSEGILQYCWLSVEKGTIYAFVVPILLIILMNVVFLVLSLNSLLKSKKKRYFIKKTDKNSNFALAKSLFIASVILLPLLGLTWIFGILAINSNTTVFAWFFTLFNSIQGAAIFYFHVIRNEMVWSKISPRLSIISSKVFGIVGDTKLLISEFSSVTKNSRNTGKKVHSVDGGSTLPKGETVLKVISDETEVNNEESEKQAKESAEQDMSIDLQDKDDMIVNSVSEGTILEETIEITAYISQENVESFDDKVAVDQKRESERVEEIQAEGKNISMEGNSTINPAVSNIKDINPTSKDDRVEGTNIEELESKGENNAEVIESSALDH